MVRRLNLTHNAVSQQKPMRLIRNDRIGYTYGVKYFR